MKPLRRELLNGLLVLVVASLLSVAFSAFQVSFNPQLWVLILMAIAIAVSGYVVFEFSLSAERRETEWLKRVGTPARFEVSVQVGAKAFLDAIKAMIPGSDYTVMNYYPGWRLAEPPEVKSREDALALILEQRRRGVVREYKRIVCFEPDVLERDQELRSGVLRVGEGPGCIDKGMGEHCRLMLSMKGCSLFLAPALVQSTIVLFGSDRAAMSVETVGHDTSSSRTVAGVLFFCDPPNAEIIEQFRLIERETEKRMIAVHKIRFPEDASSQAERAAL